MQSPTSRALPALQKDTRARKQSVTRLFDEMATVLIAEYDAETRFRARAARGAGKVKRGLQLLAKARGEAGRRRQGP